MTFSDRTLLLIAGAAVLAGCVLRLAWPGVIEYKADEQYMFERSQRAGVSEPWPALGMPSGAGGVPNPALSVWSFAGLARLRQDSMGSGFTFIPELAQFGHRLCCSPCA